MPANRLKAQFDVERQGKVDSIKNELGAESLPDSTLAQLHAELGNLYGYRLIDSCINHRLKSAEIYKRLGDSIKMYRQLLSTIEQYYIKGNLSQSLSVSYKVEAFCLNENYDPFLGEVYNGIGNNLKRQSDWQTAISFYEKSKHYASLYEDEHRLSWVMYNLAECNWRLKNYRDALEHSKSAIKRMKVHVPQYEGLARSYYAMIKYDITEKDSVHHYLTNSLHFSIKNLGYYQRNITEQLNHLANYFLREAELDSSTFYARKAFHLADAIPVVAQKEQAARYLADAFEKKGNIDSALYYQKAVSDIAYQIEKQKDLNELKHLNTKVQELKNKAIVESEQAQRKRWGLVAISSLIVLALTMLLLFNIRKQNRLKSQAQEAKLLLLKKENETKDHMLNNTMMELVKSNNGFSKLMQNIDHLTTEMKPTTKKKARSILLDYKSNLQEDTWRRFNLEFENANAHFYSALKKAATGITESELRIAAMHVSGLSNKEIASVTGQALRSIHTHKSNLRKKLDVADDTQLTHSLEKLQIS